MNFGPEETARKVQDDGIVAIVRGVFPAQKVLEIGATPPRASAVPR